MIIAKATGVSIARKNMKIILNGVVNAADQGLKEGAKGVLRKTRELTAQPGKGRIYKSGRGDGSTHQASRPGDPIASDTGRYARSLRVQRAPRRRKRLGWLTGSPLKRARWETGTQSKRVNTAKARPTLTKALKLIRSGIFKGVVNRVRRKL